MPTREGLLDQLRDTHDADVNAHMREHMTD